VLLLITGCKPSKDGKYLSNNFTITSPEDFVRLFSENGGNIDAFVSPPYDVKHSYGECLDKNGNGYNLYLLEKGYYITCQLHNIPDMKVLLQLRNYISSLWIEYNNSLTDISFLKNFQELRELSIDNGDTVIDCSILANLKNLEDLEILTDRIINLEAIYDKSQEEFKLPSLNSISIGEYTMDKRHLGYFLRDVEGLTPSDRNIRLQYGNSKGENYTDQYGNRFKDVRIAYGGKYLRISVEILHNPDFKVLTDLAYNIYYLTVEDTSPITDISFLENSLYLQTLRVRTSTIETFEPLKHSLYLKYLELVNPKIPAIESLRHLSHLKELKIALSLNMDFMDFPRKNGYRDASGFLYSIRDIANIERLNFLDSELENTRQMYLSAQEMFKISSLEQISFGENSFYRNAMGSYEFDKEADYW
jgi:hypothetical protein